MRFDEGAGWGAGVRVIVLQRRLETAALLLSHSPSVKQHCLDSNHSHASVK
jgi:hypothetical protein